MHRLDGQTAVVTGAARGIGRAIVLAFASAGAGVIACDLEPPDATAADAVEIGGRCTAVAADVSSAPQVRSLMAAALRQYGGIDILISNAGIGFPDSILTTPEERWDRVLAVNLKGAFLCVQAALPGMMERGSGSIVLISSVAARRSSLTNGAHYTCSKYGLVGLTRHLALELAGSGVRINCVCPGPTDTDLLTRSATPEELRGLANRTPLGRIAEPGDIADVVLFVAGAGARHMHGAVVDVNGGLY
jgi:NAD(P)-dependent dehydrogenase (short-subunit alcohol dehydrogenase family)